MAINLATKYESKLNERFSAGSFTDKWTSNDYNFEGTNSIKVWTLGKAVINDYAYSATSHRFGDIHEVDDEVQTLTLTRKKSFNESFDITNVQDQMFVKKANAFLKQVWDEQFIPAIDEERLSVWANGAGLGAVVASNAKPTASNVIDCILTGHAALSNNRAPRKNRVTFVNESLAVKVRLADSLKDNPAYSSKAIINGQIGVLGGFPVVAVPDDLMPGIEFLIKYKNASVDPVKLKMLRVLTEDSEVAGSLMQGLVRYDSFVLNNKENGIYVYGTNDKVCAAPTVSYTSTDHKIALSSSTAAATIKYTTDGTNPKTSSTASTYSAGFAISADTHVRAYASKSGLFNSAITDEVQKYS